MMVDQWKFTYFLKSLRNQLPLAFIVVALISVVVVIVAVLLQIRTTLETQKGKDFLTQAELNTNRLAEQIENQIFRLEGLNSEGALFNQVAFAQKGLDKLSPEERAAYMQEHEADWQNPDEEFFRRSINFLPASVELRTIILDRFPQFASILITDSYGGLAAVTGQLPGQFYFGDEAWWQQIMSGDSTVIVGQPYLSEDRQTVLMDIAMPLLAPITAETGENTDSNIRGVLQGQLRLSDFPLFQEDAMGGSNIELALVDNVTGTWLYNSGNKEQAGTSVPLEVQNNINQFPLNWGIDPDENGQNVIHSHATLRASEKQPHLSQLDLTIVLQQPAASGVEGLTAFIQPILIGGLIALIVASITGYFIARQISRPIIALTDTAAAMADGQLEQTAPETGPTELETLARSFNSMTGQLRQILQGLEQQVESRTQRLEIVATLGERLSSILSLEDLLVEVVNQIQRNFGYYHAHIYLLDDERQNLVVAAGTGTAGIEMKAQGHSIPLHAATSLVARAARSGQIVRVDNVRQTPDWLPNPLLPDTYSEMAVPILLEGNVVGVLDVQQNEIGGLDQGDAALLRSLANQVAVAVNNARLFEEVRSALAEAREVQRRYFEQAWDKDMVARRSTGRVQFSLGESTTLSEKVLAQARKQAYTYNEPSVMIIDEDEEVAIKAQDSAMLANLDGKQRVLVAPVKLGKTTIGNLQLHEAGQNREWSEADLDMIKAVIDQVAQTAENLRLLNETQERASRERLIGQVSDRLRRAPDMQSLMKAAVGELSRVLDPDRAFVKFGSAEELGLEVKGNGKKTAAAAVAEAEAAEAEAAAAEIEELLESSSRLDDEILLAQDMEMLEQYPDNETGTENGSGH